MLRILVVEDDRATRELLREHLEGAYEVVEASEAMEGLALALQHKPDCILLDLRMPEHTGFELCQTLSSLSFTRLIPIFVITGQPAEQYKDFCLNLGALEYFEKPVNFAQLKMRLAAVLQDKRVERRSETRIRLNAILKLTGTDVTGNKFELLTATQDVSASGFLCSCPAPLVKDALVEVSLMGHGERYAGRARVVRTEWRDTFRQRYGFQFVEKPRNWVLH